MNCLGSGRKWWSGTGAPVCPVCRRGPNGLGVKSPIRRKGQWTGSVPTHEARWPVTENQLVTQLRVKRATLSSLPTNVPTLAAQRERLAREIEELDRALAKLRSS